MNIPAVQGTRFLVLERSLYDVCFCDDFGGDSCSETATIGNDAVSEITLGAGVDWGAITVDCGVDSDGNIGGGEIVVVVVLVVFGAGMARLRSVVIVYCILCIIYE